VLRCSSPGTEICSTIWGDVMQLRVLAMVFSTAVAGCGENLDRQLDDCAKALETAVVAISQQAYDQYCRPLPKEKILASAKIATERTGQKITLNFDEAKPSAPKAVTGIGKSYAQVTEGLTTIFTMEDAPLRDGTPRKMGKSNGGAAILEVVGPVGSEVVRAAILFFGVSDSQGANIVNVAASSRFIYNVFPDWKNADQIVMKELISLPKKVKSAGEASKTLSHDGKEIQLLYVKDFGMFSISIRNPTAP